MKDFVLLCYTRNTPYSYDAHTPLSILSLGTFLEQNGVEIEYFDERIQGRRRFDELVARQPLIVGFSVIGGYQIASAARLSRRVRRQSPHSRVIWGGIAPTTLAKETIREDFIDYVAMGEGEETLLELFESHRSGKAAASGVRGLAYKEDGRVRINPLRTTPDVEKLPFVYQGKALEMLKGYLQLPSIREAVGYEASRGCPFLCSFCYSPNFHNDTRVKSLRKIAEELETMKALGVSDLDVYDDTLLGGRKQDIVAAAEILKRLSLSWIANLRINMLSRELLGRLEESGCKWLYFGIESNDEETLKRMKKGITAAQIREGIRIMRTSAIPAVYSLIIGLPIEGERDKIGQYLDFAEEIHRQHPAAEVQVQSYVPLPGSDLYQSAVEFGFKPPSRIIGWVDHDHFGVSNPWLEDPSLANKIYIATFLAYRYKRHFSSFPVNIVAYPLHLLSLWRIKRRAFGFYFEKYLYEGVLMAAKSWVALYFVFQDTLAATRGDWTSAHGEEARTLTQRRAAPPGSHHAGL